MSQSVAAAHAHHSTHEHAHAADLAELLALDAEVLGAYLDDAPEWIAAYLEREPEKIVDLGAGTGAGTVALARRFPTASILAVDASRAMLDRVTQSAGSVGLQQRVRTVECDLNDAWPDAAADADLVWAASSLHELSDPDRVLRDAYAALRPAGLLVTVEMDVLPSFLPADYPVAAPGLEQRLHAALTNAGWNAHQDWTANLEKAGFELVGRRQFASESSTAAVVPYARAWLGHVRSSLGERLDPGDRAALTSLVDDDAQLARTVSTVRGARTALLARRGGAPQPGRPA